MDAVLWVGWKWWEQIAERWRHSEMNSFVAQVNGKLKIEFKEHCCRFLIYRL